MGVERPLPSGVWTVTEPRTEPTVRGSDLLQVEVDWQGEDVWLEV